MTIFDRLQHDIEADQDMCCDLEDRYVHLRSDAEALACRMDAILEWLNPGPEPEIRDDRADRMNWKAQDRLYESIKDIAHGKTEITTN